MPSAWVPILSGAGQGHEGREAVADEAASQPSAGDARRIDAVAGNAAGDIWTGLSGSLSVGSAAHCADFNAQIDRLL